MKSLRKQTFRYLRRYLAGHGEIENEFSYLPQHNETEDHLTGVVKH